MQRSRKVAVTVGGIAAVLVVAAIIVFSFGGGKAGAPTPVTDTKDSASGSQTGTSETPTAGGAMTRYTDDGFIPASLTVKAGTVVNVKNDSSSQLEFSSGDHPTHTKEPELNTKTVGPGESTSFTPTKIGTWSFHNHFNVSDSGTLIVE